MNVGFTGNRIGMIHKQIEEFKKILSDLNNIQEFHHGDCVGADKEAHDIIRELYLNTTIFTHPPINSSLRAFCKGDFESPEKDYLERDHDIVVATDILLAIPRYNYEKLRSGTWSTIRYAVKQKKPVVIIYPNGTIEKR